MLSTLMHAYLASQWISIFGFLGGIMHWFETFHDPISFAAGFDLMVLMILTAIWMIYREKRWTWALTISVIPFIVFPAIGFFLYLIISDKSLPGESRPEA